MKILLLLPILIYLLLVLVNSDLLHAQQTINLFGVKELNAPVLFYNSIFIVLYSVIVFFAYDGLNIFLKYKINKQEKEIVKLKSKLYDGQEELLKRISKENKETIKNFGEKSDVKMEKLISKNNEKLEKIIKKSDEKLEEYKTSNKQLLIQHGKETDKLLGKINLIDKGILDKIKDSLK